MLLKTMLAGLVMLGIGALVGCGQQGPLYLPASQAATGAVKSAVSE